MSINCTSFCQYQVEGVCNLNNQIVKKSVNNTHENTDCIYYAEKSF